MTAGVCFRSENRGWMQDQWSWVFSNFGIKEIWELHGGSADSKIYQKVTLCDSAVDLPSKRPLVVLAPIDGRYIKGEKSLVDFKHPFNAIYLFGGTHANLSEDDLGGRKPDALIYIPTIKHEMYSHSAGYITLYDRLVKRGDFG